MTSELDRAIIEARKRWEGATPADAPAEESISLTQPKTVDPASGFASDRPAGGIETTLPQNAKISTTAGTQPEVAPSYGDGFEVGFKTGYEKGRAEGFRDALEMADYVARSGFVLTKKAP